MSTLEHLAYDDSQAEIAMRRRWQRGDRDALTALYQRYERRLYAFCHRMVGNPDDAADLVQETFLRVIRRLPELDVTRLNLSAYLHTTARNLFYKQAERAKRVQLEERMEDVAPAADVLEEDPERAALLDAQQVEVRDANMRLAPRQRMVLALRELEDRSYAEIGEILGMNENAVAQLISRARIRLREELRMGQIDRSALSPETQRLLPTLAAYCDGQLKGEKLAAVEAALAESAECRAVVDAFGQASKRYRALLPAVPLAFLGTEVARAAEAEGLIHGHGAAGDPAPWERDDASQATQAPDAPPQPEPGPHWTQDDVPTVRDLPAVGAAAGGGGGAPKGTGGGGRRHPRRRSILAGVAAGVALLAGGAAWVAAGGDDSGEPRAAAEVTSAPGAVPLASTTGAEETQGETLPSEPDSSTVASTAPELVERAGQSEVAPPLEPTERAGDTTIPPLPTVIEAPTTTADEQQPDEPPPGTTGKNPPQKPPKPPPKPPPTTTTITPPATTDAPPETTVVSPETQPPTTPEPPPTTVAPPPVPNLIVSGISGASVAGAAPSLSWSVTVTNIGTGDAGASSVAFQFTGGGASAGIAALGPGASQTVTFRTGCRAATVTATATADARGAVAESSEGDNAATSTAQC